jgi:hypothetical protein
VSSVPIAKPTPQESRIKKQSCGEVNIGFAAHLLGVDAGEVVWLCKSGVLRARRNSHGSWKIDEVFLRLYKVSPDHAAAAGFRSSVGEERATPLPLASQSLPTPCPPGACEGHWERRGRVVPAFRADLCRACFAGRPLPVKSDEDAS